MKTTKSSFLIFLAWFFLAPGISVAQATYVFDLPAQSLSESLRAVGQRTSMNVMFEPRLVEGLDAPPLQAETTAVKAIRRLLVGTKLVALRTASDSILVQSASSESAADAQVPESASVDELHTVVVTGSRIARADVEGPSEVIVIGKEQMSERGYTTVYDALSDLTINNGVKWEGAEAARYTPDVQALNLRGFGVGTTLVLVNGRRLTNYPAAYQSNATVFNFGAIPAAAVERIEVLAQGASAIYGSDAVAGVVNIILRPDIDGTTVNVLAGAPTETKSPRGDTRIQLLNGKLFDRGNYSFALEYQRRKAILGKNYSQYDDNVEDYPYGQGVYDRSALILDLWRFYLVPGQYYRDPAQYGNPQQLCSASGGGLVYASRPGAGNFCGDPNGGVAGINFQNDKEAWSAYFNGNLKIGDHTELFTDLLYYTSKSETNNPWMFLTEEIFDQTRPDSIGIGSFDWYTVQRLWNEKELGMDLGQKYNEDSYTVSVGARGELGERHKWEASATYSDYKFHSAIPWLKWRETIDNMLGTHLGTSFDGTDWWSGGTLGEGLSFGLGDPNNLYGPARQGLLDSIGIQTFDNKSDDLALQFSLTGDLWNMPSGPLSYALVLEYEDSSLKYLPDELMRQRPPTTDVNGNTIQGTLTGSGWWRRTGYTGDGSRQRWSVGGELRVPVLDPLTLNLAGRYDKYDSTSTSFGGDFTPSASLEFRPFKNFLIRAGYTEIFRAPDMAQVFVQSGFFIFANDYVSCQELYVSRTGSDAGFNPADCEAHSVFGERVGAQEFGEKPLDAETGDTWWAGFSWDIVNNLNLTVDYTNMTLEGQVLQQSTQGLLDDEYACFIGEEPVTTPCDVVAKQVIRGSPGVGGVRFVDRLLTTSYNQAQEHAEFVDVRLTYALNTKIGTFRFDGLYNNMLKHTSQITSTSAELNRRDDPLNGGWDFRSSITGSFGWSYGDFATNLTMIRRGSTTVFNCTSGTNGCVGNVSGENYLATGNWRVGAYTTWNWTASYNWTEDFLTRIRVVNVFDEKPPRDDTFDFLNIPWYNINVYPGAGIGRYAALELQYKF